MGPKPIRPDNILSDETRIHFLTWGEIKEEAMQEGYLTNGNNFVSKSNQHNFKYQVKSLDEYDMKKLKKCIEAQKKQGDMLCLQSNADKVYVESFLTKNCRDKQLLEDLHLRYQALSLEEKFELMVIVDWSGPFADIFTDPEVMQEFLNSEAYSQEKMLKIFDFMGEHDTISD